MQDYSALARLLPISEVYHYFKDPNKTHIENLREMSKLSKSEMIELAQLIRAAK